MDSTISRQVKEYSRLWREANAMYEEWAKRHQLSYSELLILSSLWDQETPCTQKQICREWQLPKQTVNTILKNYQNRGWISFEVLPDDRRNKKVSLTGEGRDAVRDTIDALHRHECRAWERISGERRASLLEGTALYLQYFKDSEDNRT